MENPETKPPPSPTPSTVSSISSRSSESELMVGPSSPNSVRLYLPKPRIPVQRRATITGASPVSKHAPLSLEQVNTNERAKFVLSILTPQNVYRSRKAQKILTIFQRYARWKNCSEDDYFVYQHGWTIYPSINIQWMLQLDLNVVNVLFITLFDSINDDYVPTLCFKY
jgi:hypothetical protein